MPGNISEFLSNIRDKGIAKTSHFDVSFTLPKAISPDTDIPRLLKLRCEAAELPGRQIGTTDNRIYGPIYKTPYESLYSEMTMTFIDTSDMKIRYFFDTWIDRIYNPNTNAIKYIDDIVSDIVVTQYDLEGTPETLNPILKFSLFRSFPVNIDQMTVAWTDDAPHEVVVTFFYERYILEKGPNPVFSTVESLPKPDYMVEYPEDVKFNDVQMNELQRAQEEANRTQRQDTGLFGNVIRDIANKVKNL